MTKEKLKNKVLDIQKMGDLELESFEMALCVSELVSKQKDILFKAIAIRRTRNREINEAMAVMGEMDEMDENEL